MCKYCCIKVNILAVLICCIAGIFIYPDFCTAYENHSVYAYYDRLSRTKQNTLYGKILQNKVKNRASQAITSNNRRTLSYESIARMRQYNRRAVFQNRLALINRLKTDKKYYLNAENELSRQSNTLAGILNNISDNFDAAAGFIKPIIGGIASPYGYRTHPIFRVQLFHTGVDIAGFDKTPIHASNSGRIIYSDWYGGYGKAIIVSHGKYKGNRITTLYGHLSQILVNDGQMVSKGQIIGYEGSTGYSTGPHLHFEIRQNGKPVNPRNFIKL